jgi:hypothetical protein
MNTQIEEKEKQFHEQLQQLIGKILKNFFSFLHHFKLDKSYKIENDIQQRVHDAEQRALLAEEQSKVCFFLITLPNNKIESSRKNKQIRILYKNLKLK